MNGIFVQGEYQLLISIIKVLLEEENLNRRNIKKIITRGICILLLICIKKSLSVMDLDGFESELFKLSILDLIFE